MNHLFGWFFFITWTHNVATLLVDLHTFCDDFCDFVSVSNISFSNQTQFAWQNYTFEANWNDTITVKVRNDGGYYGFWSYLHIDGYKYSTSTIPALWSVDNDCVKLSEFLKWNNTMKGSDKIYYAFWGQDLPWNDYRFCLFSFHIPPILEIYEEGTKQPSETVVLTDEKRTIPFGGRVTIAIKDCPWCKYVYQSIENRVSGSFISVNTGNAVVTIDREFRVLKEEEEIEYISSDSKTKGYTDQIIYYSLDENLLTRNSLNYTISILVCGLNCEQCSEDNYHCLKCKDGHYQLIDELSQCVHLEDIPENYYKDESNIYFPCYPRCKTCNSWGIDNDNKCTICSDNYPIAKEVLKEGKVKYYNCYSDCLNNDMYTIVDTYECVSDCTGYYNLENTKNCYSSCPGLTWWDPLDKICKESLVIWGDVDTDTIFDIIENDLVRFEDSQLNGDGYTVEITTTDKEQSDNSLSSIDLGECENILRHAYNIPDDEHLIIVKMDIVVPDSITNQVKYKVYSAQGVELDLKKCEDVKIVISYPITNFDDLNWDYGKELSEQGIDIYNHEDAFFNDICTPFTKDGNDVIWDDRRNDIFVDVDFCDSGCTYDGIDYDTNKVKCVCDVKDITETEKEISQEKGSKWFESVMSINIEIVKCYKWIKWNNWKNNVGFWFALGVIVLSLWLLFIFVYKGYPQWLSRLFSHNYIDKSKPNPQKKNMNSFQISKEDNNSKSKYKQDNKIPNWNSFKLTNTPRNWNNIKAHASKLNTFKKQNPIKCASSENSREQFQIIVKKSIRSLDQNKNKNKIEWKHEINVTRVNAHSLYFTINSVQSNRLIEWYPFLSAVQKDKRSFCQIFFSQVYIRNIIFRAMHPISIFENKYTNISLFLFNLILSFTLNGLFYTNNVISSKYHNNGKLDLLTNILRSVYSCLCQFVWFMIWEKLCSYYKILHTVVCEVRNKTAFNRLFLNAIKKIKKQLKWFYIINFFCMICFWYYLTWFCIVYKNSQFSWFEGGWTSFAISIFTSFAISLLITMWRVGSLMWKVQYWYNITMLFR